MLVDARATAVGYDLQCGAPYTTKVLTGPHWDLRFPFIASRQFGVSDVFGLHRLYLRHCLEFVNLYPQVSHFVVAPRVDGQGH